MLGMERTIRTAGRAFDPQFVLGGLIVLVFAVWVASDAGYQPTTWYPGALFLLSLAVVWFVANGRPAPSRSALVAIGCLAAFAAWCGLSVTWSGDQGIAWDGANRTLLYLIVYSLFASIPWRRGSVPVFLSALALAALGIGLVDLARAAGGNTASFFIHGRLSAPAGYPNAACAVYLFSLWPLAYLAARRELPALVRGIALAAATALGELALLTQSRASLFVVPVVVVVYLVLVPGRVRAALALIPIGIALLLTRGELLDLYKPIKAGQNPSGPIHSVLGTIGLSAAAVLVAWTVVSLVDRRVELSAGAARSLRLAAIAIAAIAIVGGAAAVGLARPSPEDRVSKAWHDFKSGQPAETGNSYFGLGLGSNRYDFWRVALGEFRDHPVRGVGVDNFAQDYVRERRSSEEPLYPHSLILRVLAQTGIVGAILFGGFVVAAAIAAGTAVWRRADLSGGVTRAGLVAVAYFAIHGSIDWFWEFPGLAAPALAWLGLAAGRGRAQTPARRTPLVSTALAVVVAAAAGASFLFPWLAELDARRASDTWATRPTGAFADLDHARALNPLSARADLLAGAIASRLNEVPRMRSAFQGALERDPRNWYAHLELGLAEAALGHKRAALKELGEASQLNPREGVVASVRREVAAGRTVDRAQVDRQFVERVRGRIGPN